MGSETRSLLKKVFLNDYFENSDYVSVFIPGDASFRSYERVTSIENGNLILMDCPPEHYELKPFVQMAVFLQENHFSSPKIYAIDEKNGFLLLEDFGHIRIADYCKNLSTNEQEEIYRLLLDILVSLQRIKPIASLPKYSIEMYLKELELYLDWYVDVDQEARGEFLAIWNQLLSSITNLHECVVLLDYHAENAMLLSDKEGISKIGLLDFQDARIGSKMYDVVSLLEDARCDIDPDFAERMLEYYLEQTQTIDKPDAIMKYHILGAQRNIRILGVFARKAKRDKQDKYLSYIPRILKYLEHDLMHEKMESVRKWMLKYVN